jgi:phenylpropionate dioxygenase-like ring-hydroxylating dioxygenase large terminal subunit
LLPPAAPSCLAPTAAPGRGRRAIGLREAKHKRRGAPRSEVAAALRRSAVGVLRGDRDAEEQQSSPFGEERFDWLDKWYPLAPVCDLDPHVPHGKTVLGLSIVDWYDRGAGEGRVFDDACLHCLASLSEGRIDDRGRLQCVYHDWCFDGAGTCKFIPQAPPLGPPMHTSSRACVASYPCVVQNNILWFYQRADPRVQGRAAKEAPAAHSGN